MLLLPAIIITFLLIKLAAVKNLNRNNSVYLRDITPVRPLTRYYGARKKTTYRNLETENRSESKHCYKSKFQRVSAINGTGTKKQVSTTIRVLLNCQFLVYHIGGKPAAFVKARSCILKVNFLL